MLPTLVLPPPGPPPPTKAVTDMTAGSSSTICASCALLVAHGGKADVLRGQGSAAQPARVLLREEALGHDLEQIDVQRHGADRPRTASAIWWRSTQRSAALYS